MSRDPHFITNLWWKKSPCLTLVETFSGKRKVRQSLWDWVREKEHLAKKVVRPLTDSQLSRWVASRLQVLISLKFNVKLFKHFITNLHFLPGRRLWITSWKNLCLKPGLGSFFFVTSQAAKCSVWDPPWGSKSLTMMLRPEPLGKRTPEETHKW